MTFFLTGWHSCPEDMLTQGYSSIREGRVPRRRIRVGGTIRMHQKSDPKIGDRGMHAAYTSLDAIRYRPAGKLCLVQLSGDGYGNDFAFSGMAAVAEYRTTLAVIPRHIVEEEVERLTVELSPILYPYPPTDIYVAIAVADAFANFAKATGRSPPTEHKEDWRKAYRTLAWHLDQRICLAAGLGDLPKPTFLQEQPPEGVTSRSSAFQQFLRDYGVELGIAE